MKIALLTFIYSYNPGTTLQAFALQKAVESLQPDIHCFILRQFHAKKGIPLFLKRPSWKTFKGYVFVTGSRKAHLRFAEKYNHFYPSKPIYKSDLFNIQDEFDKIMVGSDQVWNPEYCKERPMRYLLDFVSNNEKKVSYGSSFGIKEVPEDIKQDYIDYLGKFKYLSVREEGGAKVIYDLLKRDVPIVLDPTLLLNKREWEKLAKLPKEENFIFLYEVMHRPEAVDFARKLSKETGLKIVHKQVYDYELNNNSRYWFMTPEEWMGYILKAKYVVTTSFHGTAFSINFNKQFFVLPRPTTSSRVDHLLSLFGLESRKIDITKVSNGLNVEGISDIDYSKVNLLLEQERHKSKDYLRNIVLE